MAEGLSLEVVMATSEQQVLVALKVEEGATVADAIVASGIGSRFPELVVEEMPVGIWGKLVARHSRVREGDRVELYRPLEIDPREARRQRALAETR
ncbi:MAG: RnfH family protein [Gammaproteobacteria bacterium]|jgi:putative ubiquitin-RnfH superfamily antitoxin RatB of RatAB toxin-antitoxin module|nr:RnfH family protein [Gammaproteobacteria bacterium]MDH3846649.1 RnfH family protein [Gammaproteobacteria bacterium]MDH3864261.1 RnfH family protein [Gammaproteobacteria bacterium]MDH3905057.1 RnfH family protein [Gammaproteobacteria bacterium]MDH3953566.1 RnfH family protein [Gammaproteobacteria bacterium]